MGLTQPGLGRARVSWARQDSAGHQGKNSCPLLPTVLFWRRGGVRTVSLFILRAVSTTSGPGLAVQVPEAALWRQEGKKGSPSIPRGAAPTVMIFSVWAAVIIGRGRVSLHLSTCLCLEVSAVPQIFNTYLFYTCTYPARKTQTLHRLPSGSLWSSGGERKPRDLSV